MDARAFENVVELHGEDVPEVSQHVCDQIFSSAEDGDNQIRATLQACRFDDVGGTLPIPEYVLEGVEGLRDEDLPSALDQLERQAHDGSVALQVLEALFQDERRQQRTVTITGFAELVDVDCEQVIDIYGARWPISDVDGFHLSCAGWNRITSIESSGAVGSTTDPTSVCTSWRVASALRAVVGNVYASLCAAGDTGVNDLTWVGVAVAGCKINVATARAIAMIATSARGDFVAGTSRMLLPCGAELDFECCPDGGGSWRTFEKVQIGLGDCGVLSGMGRFAVNVLSAVLMGAGVNVVSDIEDEASEFGIEGWFAHVIWCQAAVACQALVSEAYPEQDGVMPVLDIVRYMTIYHVGSRCIAQNVDTDDSALATRVLFAKEVAMDLMESAPGWDTDAFFDGQAAEALPAARSSLEATVGIDRREFLHFGAGSSDLPVLEDDFVSDCGLQVLARRGVVMRPDRRQSVVIRKHAALWGRVKFNGEAFVSKPLVNVASILRALVPVQGVGAGPVNFRQFEEQPPATGARGNEIANILLSGAYGGDQALWALNKILYSGVGLKPGSIPSFLLPLAESRNEDGFGIVSLLGSVAVRCLEVIVDDRGRVLLDCEGDFPVMQLRLDGRRVRCVEVDDGYSGGRVGTISNNVCMF